MVRKTRMKAGRRRVRMMMMMRMADWIVIHCVITLSIISHHHTFHFDVGENGMEEKQRKGEGKEDKDVHKEDEKKIKNSR